MAGDPQPKTGRTPKQLQAARRREWKKDYEAGAKEAWRRSGARCERCHGLAEHTHHKIGRQHKDANLPANLMPVCDLCHRWIHAHPAEAREQGYMGSRLA